MVEHRVLTLWRDENVNEEDTLLLRMVSHDVPMPVDRAVQKDIDTLIEAFIARDDALGLAAPQIGISRKIIVFRIKGFDAKENWTRRPEDYDVLINPRITQTRGEQVYMAEGCLSCPEIQVEVGRFPEIKVRAVDSRGRKYNKRYTDFLARIVQHEIDHLQGKLIIDYEGTLSYPKERSSFFDKIFSS